MSHFSACKVPVEKRDSTWRVEYNTYNSILQFLPQNIQVRNFLHYYAFNQKCISTGPKFCSLSCRFVQTDIFWPQIQTYTRAVCLHSFSTNDCYQKPLHTFTKLKPRIDIRPFAACMQKSLIKVTALQSSSLKNVSGKVQNVQVVSPKVFTTF